MRSVLQRFVEGTLTGALLAEWAEALECRDDIEISAELQEVMWQLANPELSESLDHSLAVRVLESWPSNASSQERFPLAMQNQKLNSANLSALAAMADRMGASLKFGAAWIASSSEQRAEVISKWPHGAEWEYPSPWRLACRMGEQGEPRERIIAALVLSAVESKEDPRDDIIAHCVVYHSCLIAGLDPDEIFSLVASTLPLSTATRLRVFLRRSAEDRALSSFFLEQRVDQNGEVELRRVS